MAAEGHSNAVVAREWERALPAEIGAETRREIATAVLYARDGGNLAVSRYEPMRLAVP
jgi:hypothetical protein